MNHAIYPGGEFGWQMRTRGPWRTSFLHILSFMATRQFTDRRRSLNWMHGYQSQ